MESSNVIYSLSALEHSHPHGAYDVLAYTNSCYRRNNKFIIQSLKQRNGIVSIINGNSILNYTYTKQQLVNKQQHSQTIVLRNTVFKFK